MTALCEDDVQVCRVSADGSNALREESDTAEASPVPSVTRVPLHGPVDSHDVMCAKVLFALCGSVFPHPLLLAQQLLGIEDQDFPEFQLNVAEAGNNCIDIVAAYLTNLRVMQTEEEPNPPVSLNMIQPRHAATVASVAAKARDLLSELALARATVKPRKAPKNKAIESAARAAAAAAATPATLGSLSASGPAAAAASSASSSSSALSSSGEAGSNSSTGSDLTDAPSDTAAAFTEDALGSSEDSNDDSSSCSGLGHQDTSREDNTPRTAREEEERLLYALQGPAAAEETLKMARARPAGCKGNPTTSDARAPPECASDSHNVATNTAAAPHQAGSPAAVAATAGSPRAPPPPPPVRTASSMAQYASGTASGPAAGTGPGGSSSPSQRYSQEICRDNRGGGAGGRGGAGSALQTALSCPVTGLPEMLASSSPPSSGIQGGAGMHGVGNGSSTSQTGLHLAPSHPQSQQHQQQHQGGHQGHRRNGGSQQQQSSHGNGNGGNGNGHNGNGRRNHNHHGNGSNAGGSGGAGMRASPAMPSTLPSVFSLQQQQQQHAQQQQQQQQQQLAVAQLLGLRSSFANAGANNPYGNLAVNLQGAAYSASGLAPFSPAAGAGGRLDLPGLSPSMAALEQLAAAQQAAAISAAAASAGLSNPLGHPHHHYGFPAGFGNQAGSMQLGQLTGQLGSAGAALGGLGGAAASLVAAAGGVGHQQHQQQQAAATAAAAAALLQQSGGMIHLTADSLGGAQGADPWSNMNVLLQAQLAGSLQ